MLLDDLRHGGFDHLEHLAPQVLPALERKEPEVIDDLPLLVHHVVVVEKPLSRLEVVALDALLGLFDRLRNEAVCDHVTLVGAPHLIHDRGDPLGPKHPHQVIFQGEEELAGTGISLATRPAAQLTVDPT